MKPTNTLVAVLMAVAVVAAACGGDTTETTEPADPGPTSTQSSGDTTTSSPSADTTEPSDGGEELTFSLSYQAAPADTDPWHHMATTFKELVEDASDGRITVELFGGGQLSGGDQATEIELVQNGTIDMSILPTGTLSAIDPRFQIAGLPWLVPSTEVAEEIVTGPLGAETLDWLRDRGMEPLAIGSNGFRQLANNVRPVTSPEDVAGLTIRVPGSPVLVQTWEELGAEPVVMNFGELYTALQQGTVDGEELPFVFKLSTNFYEVEGFGSEINYSWDMIYLVMNPDLWNSLTEADQSLISEAAIAAAEEERQFLADSNAGIIAELEANGMEIATLSDDEVAAFQDLMEPVYAAFEDDIGADLIARWRAASSE